ncbi:ras-related protein Rab-28-like isoform X3 [Bacillus rossius redtenbacheri]|uniref:ras-related protein Rab-28-like isoform X3 n=1 Tax=Bacillus rossius redtenbacheri TaxID=93214 RepID=UPI002FDEDB14
MCESDDECFEKHLKFALIGNQGTGKSSLVMKYRSGSFTRQYHPTAGIDFSTKKIVLPGGVNVTVHLWDVGGSDLEHQRAVRSDRHQKFALEHGLSTYQVSARTGEMVALCIQKMVAEALGLRLTRAEQEEQQPVIEAEISRAEPGVASGAARPVASSSSICCLQ